MWGTLAILTLLVLGVFYFYRAHQPIPDATVVKSVKAKLYDDVNLRKCTIEVTAQNGVVTLVGLVNSEADKANALQIAHQQQGVKQVVDQLVVQTAQVSAPPVTEPPLSSSVPQQASPRQPKTIEVPGYQGWTPTGIQLSVGDSVEISSSGAVTMSVGWAPTPPAGVPPNCGARGGFPAGQLPCWSLIGRIGDRGEIFYVGSKITFRAPTAGQLFLGVNDDTLGDNRGSWTATVNSTVTGPRLGYAATWLGFANETVSQDREAELHKNCGADFKRVYVPLESGNGFTDLCHSVGKTCERVCDWEGSDLPCTAVSLGGHRDGTRIALCR